MLSTLMISTLLRDAQELQPDVVRLRRALHRHPELGLQLPRTQAVVIQALDGLGLSVRKGGPDIADPGWDFNIGEAAVNIDIIAGEKAMAAAAPIRKMFLDEMASSGNYKETFASFVDSVLTGKKATGILQTAGWMDAAVLDYLAGELSITPATPVIAANDRGLLHLYRESKIARGAALSIDEIRLIPEVISGYEAVLWDSQDPALLYVFSSGSMKGKIVVAVDYKLKGQGIVNLVKTAGKAQTADLRDGRYVVIKGRI